MPSSIRTTWNDTKVRAAFTSAYPVAVKACAAEARGRARWNHVASTVQPVIRQVGLSGEGGVGVGASDWRRLEFGTRPHTEAPIEAQALKFPDGGFARGRVPHPGTHAEPFLAPVLPQFAPIYREAVRLRLAI